MVSRSTGLLAGALGLLLGAGCLHPVTEKVDATICGLATRPRDLDPEQPATLPATMLPTAGKAGAIDSTISQTN
jgi:hypothetical protein